MAKLYLVRHGQAAARYGVSLDPGLDDLGRNQAEQVAEKLSSLGPLPILSSPLARARETAAPLARVWKSTPRIEAAVAEIPAPAGVPLDGRAAWLSTFMAGSWSSLDPALRNWRMALKAALTVIDEDTVIFSQYVAINAAVGTTLQDDRVIVFSPQNCSVTILETDGKCLTLTKKGEEAPLTRVN
jgi:broad specificity phosphatase PhoE